MSKLDEHKYNHRNILTIHSVDSRYSIHFLEALVDIKYGFLGYRSWLTSSLRVSRQRYRQTYLGPWWTTLSSILTLFVLSLLRTAVNPDLSFTESLSYVGIGWTLFNFLSKPFSSGITIFIIESPFATHTTTMSSSVFRDTANGVIEFAHEFVAILILIIIFHEELHPAIPTTIFIVASIIVSNFGMTLWLGSISCRFRDFAPIALLILRVQMFISPVFWSISEVPASSPLVHLAEWNPFSYFMTLMRDGYFGSSESSLLRFNPTVAILVFAIANLAIGVGVFSYSRKRLVYWAEST